MLVESEVRDMWTGRRLAFESIERGTTRLETLTFRVSKKLVRFTRETITQKWFGFVWKAVKKDVLVLGTYAGDGIMHRYVMPPAEIPRSVLACGRYRLTITYTAESETLKEVNLRQEYLEFVIV